MLCRGGYYDNSNSITIYRMPCIYPCCVLVLKKFTITNKEVTTMDCEKCSHFFNDEFESGCWVYIADNEALWVCNDCFGNSDCWENGVIPSEW